MYPQCQGKENLVEIVFDLKDLDRENVEAYQLALRLLWGIQQSALHEARAQVVPYDESSYFLCLESSIVSLMMKQRDPRGAWIMKVTFF